LRQWEHADEGNEGSRGFFVSGIFFGAALAAKYTAVLGLPFLVFEAVSARNKSLVMRRVTIFCLGAVAPLIPWWVRTGLWTGNPFFPQAAFLGGDIGENLNLLRNFRGDTVVSSSFWVRAAAIFKGSLAGASDGRSGFLGPAALMAVPLLFFFARTDERARKLLFGFSLSYALLACLSGRLRFFIPSLAVLWCVLGAALVHGSAGPWPRRLLAAAAALNVFWMALAWQKFYDGADFFWGRTSAADYLRREHPGNYAAPSQGAFDFIAAQGGCGKIFIIGDARSRRSPGPAGVSGPFNKPAYARLLESQRSPADAAAALAADGFSHVVMNVAEWRRVTPAAYKEGFHQERLKSFLSFLGEPLYRDEWTWVFGLPGFGRPESPLSRANGGAAGSASAGRRAVAPCGPGRDKA
jgi:hypothetical protein